MKDESRCFRERSKVWRLSTPIPIFISGVINSRKNEGIRVTFDQ